jgi:hypothetical protein
MLEGETALPPLPDPYRAFLTTAAGITEVIDLPIAVGRVPELQVPRGTRVFTAGGSWCMDREGEEYVLYYDPPAGGRAWWKARFPADVSRISLSVSDLAFNHLSYPLDQIILMFLLGRRGGIIVHGAGFGRNGGGMAFLGPSGAGKTTISGILRKGDWSPLSDDRLIVRKVGGAYRLFGTPWPGEGLIAENRSFPLERIFFLKQGGENLIREVPPAEAIRRLVTVTSIPWFDREALPAVLDFCDELIGAVRFSEITFRRDDSARTFLEDALS